ncbi:MAG: two-component regulator propeller domain-containing protein [Ignavibacteria bacterium]
MRHISVLIIYFNSLILPDNIFAQTYDIKFSHLTIEDGLSQSVVTDIIQDSKGFIWIATQDGLNRYDGYEFKVFKNDPKDSTSLSHNHINYLFEDSKQNIWVCTNGGGLCLYDKFNESFISFVHDPTDSTSISYNYIMCINEDVKGNLWVGTYSKGLNKLIMKGDPLISPKNVSFQNFYFDPSKKNSLSDNRIYRIGKDYLGNLWIGTLNGLNLLVEDEKGVRFNNFFNIPGNNNSLSDNFIRCLMSDKNGNLWVGTDSGGIKIIYKKDLKNAHKGEIVLREVGNSHSNVIQGISINHIYEDDSGIIWISIWGDGLGRYDPKLELITYFTHNKTDPQSISSNDLILSLQDKSGMIWVGTYGGGLNIFNPHPKKFTHLKHNPQNDNSLSDNLVFATCTDYQNNLWLGTWNGLNKLNPNRDKVTRYFNDPNDKLSISNNRITAIKESKIRPGLLWVGTLDGGLNLYIPPLDGFIRINSESFFANMKISNDRINCILEDSKGVLWVGTLSGGLNKLKKPLPETGNLTDIKKHLDSLSFITYRYNKDDITSLPSDRIESIFEDSEGIVWIGSYYGLCFYDESIDGFKNIELFTNNKNQADKDRFSSICESEDKNLWFGTWGQGIKLLEYKNKRKGNFTFRTLKKTDGLPNNYVYSILCDKNSDLWIATNKGLSKYNCETGLFRNYDATDGLQSNEFKGGASYNEKTGEMYFGGINGLNIFIPENIKDNKFLPPVTITNFKLFNKPVTINKESVLTKSITELDEITLSYEQYIFSLEFTAFNYNSPCNNRYAYMLEGFDKDWNYTDSKSRVAVYTNLDGGEYTFRVKASNNDGYWNEEGASLKIKILPPFWETIWFYILSGLVLILIVFVIYKWRLRSIERQKKLLEIEVQERTKELQELNASKNKFFSIVSHDLKGPFQVFMNTSQFLASDIDDLNKKEIKGLAEGLLYSSSNLYKLLDNLLQWSKIQMGGITVSKTKVNVKKIINDNLKLLDESAAWKGIRLKDEAVESYVYSDENMLNTVIRNLISNAIKFTGKGGEIKINTTKNGSNLKFCVADSGIGIPQEVVKNLFKIDYKYSTKGTANEGGSGLGLIICKEFIELTNGSIWIESKKNKGTKVFFTQQIYNS